MLKKPLSIITATFVIVWGVSLIFFIIKQNDNQTYVSPVAENFLTKIFKHYKNKSTLTIVNKPMIINNIKVPILTYHYVEYVKDPRDTIRKSLDIVPHVFEEQLKTIKESSYTSLFIKDLGEYFNGKQNLPAKPIIITFDDGYRSFYTDVFPLLKKYQIKATIYIIVNFLDYPNFLTTKQLREIEGSGLVEIGSHTLHHMNVKTIPPDLAKKEIFESKSKLESIIGKPVFDFAYPYGDYNEQSEKFVKEAGYLTSVTVKSGIIQSPENRYALFRLRPGGRVGKELIEFLSPSQALVR